MSSGIKRWGFICAALLAAMADTWAAAKEGMPLPAVPVSVEGMMPALDGKIVLVDVWASWCGPCRKSFPELEALYLKYKDRGLLVLGISVDRKAADMQKFKDEMKPTFPVVRDAKQKYVAALGVTAMPTSLLCDRKGVVRKIHSGFKGHETVAQLTKDIEALIVE
jgi:thiol-disulfide isomerase/thioredoxin